MPATAEILRPRVVARLAELTGGLPGPVRSPAAALAAGPGKCLRSAVLITCAGFGPRNAPPDSERVVRLAALVELIHLASLLHDDVIDRATVRRGRPAAHIVVGTDHAGLAGLACFALARTEAADLGPGVAAAVSGAVAELTYGELLDVERAFDTTLSLRDYIQMVRGKTGELFGLSCFLGAVEAGLDEPMVWALVRFGREFGVAFQVIDDCLDLAESGTGKPAGTDHMLGLFGAPTLCALHDDPSGDLRSLLLSPSFGPSDLPRLRVLVNVRGGLPAARELARRCYVRALTAVADLGERPHKELVDVTASVRGATQ